MYNIMYICPQDTSYDVATKPPTNYVNPSRDHESVLLATPNIAVSLPHPKAPLQSLAPRAALPNA